jgi:hypothetical protein
LQGRLKTGRRLKTGQVSAVDAQRVDHTRNPVEKGLAVVVDWHVQSVRAAQATRAHVVENTARKSFTKNMNLQ